MNTKKKWTITLAVILLVTLSVAGYLAIAAEYGSEEDPLVTLSYINNILSPQVMQKLEQELSDKAQEVSAEIDTKIKAASDELDMKIAAYEAAAAEGNISDDLINSIADAVIERMQKDDDDETAKAPVWEVVRLEAGKTVTCSIGCELVLRLGSATCVSSGTTGPINLTDGTVLGPDKQYAVNNLYLVTIEGRGLYTADGCTVLICGDYVIN